MNTPETIEQSKPAVASSDLLGVGRTYRNLGNISAVDGWASVGLRCDVCMVEWVGCWDMAACPECGNHDDWDRLMEARGYYKRETPNSY